MNASAKSWQAPVPLLPANQKPTPRTKNGTCAYLGAGTGVAAVWIGVTRGALTVEAGHRGVTRVVVADVVGEVSQDHHPISALAGTAS